MTKYITAAATALLLVSGTAFASEGTPADPQPNGEDAEETVAQTDEVGTNEMEPGLGDVGAPDDAGEIAEQATVEEALEDDEAGGIDLPVSISASLGTRTTMGVLAARDSETVTNSVSQSLGLSVAYPFLNDELTASTSFSYSYNLTENGSDVRCERESGDDPFDADCRLLRGRFGDIGLGLSWAGVTESFTGVHLNAGLSASLPTSRYSRFQKKIATLGTSIGLSRGFGSFRLAYGFGFSKNFHRYTSIVADTERFEISPLARSNSPEQIAEDQIALTTGVLPSFSVSNSLSASYGFDFGLSTSLSFSLGDSWTYDNGTITEDDEFTAENAVVGRGHSQVMTGAISASYGFLDHYSVSASMATSGPPKTADNESFRFPFFDTEKGNLSATSVGLNLSASF